jgi:hypothetical protein
MAKWRYRYFIETLWGASYEAARLLEMDYAWHFDAQGEKFHWYIQRDEMVSAKVQLDMTVSVNKLVKEMNLRKEAVTFGLYNMWPFAHSRRGLKRPRATVHVFIPSATGRATIKSGTIILDRRKSLSDMIVACAKDLIEKNTEETSERVVIDALLLANPQTA